MSLTKDHNFNRNLSSTDFEATEIERQLAPTHPTPPVLPLLLSLKGDRAFRRLKRAKTANVKHLSLRSMPHLAQKTYKKHEPTKQAVASKQSVLFVGIVVSKKVGNAVVRNKVRRRIKEGIAELIKEHALPKQALDIVIIARPSAAKADFETLKQNVYTAMKKGNLL